MVNHGIITGIMVVGEWWLIVVNNGFYRFTMVLVLGFIWFYMGLIWLYMDTNGIIIGIYMV